MSAAEVLIPEDDTAARAAFQTQYDCTWGAVELPEGALVAVDRAYTTAGGEGRFGAFTTAPADDPDAIWAAISQSEATPRTSATYLRQTLIDNGCDRRAGRGGASASRWVTHLWSDIDTARGLHTVSTRDGALPLPDDDTALDLIHSAPWGPPSLVVDSGGGLYAMWTLVEPRDAQDPATKELLTGFERWLVQTWTAAGHHIDENVASDLARVLKPAGVLNRKRAPYVPTTVVESSPSLRYDPEDILAMCPEPVAPAVVVRTTEGELSDGATPGDRLAGSVETLREMLRSIGMVERRGDSWTYPRPDGTTHRSETHGTIKVGADGVHRLVAAPGTRLEADLGSAVSAWSLLITRWCGGDARLAARIAARYEPDYTSMLDAIQGLTPEQVAEAFPAPVRGEVIAPIIDPDGAVSASPVWLHPRTIDRIGPDPIRGTVSLAEALESDTPMWVPVAEDEDRFVVVDRRRAYGLWHHRSVWHADKEEAEGGHWEDVFDRICSWVAWKSGVTATLTVGAFGQTRAAADETYDVTVYTARGVRKTVQGLPGDIANSFTKVANAANAAVEMPESRADKEKAENMLRQLGYSEQQQRYAYTACGWTYDETGELFFATPGGSMRASGPDLGLVAQAPPGSDEGALAAESLGAVTVAHLPETREDLAHAVTSVRQAFDIAPTRPDVIAAILGTVFGAPLMLPVRGVPFLQGDPSTGKSVLGTLVTAYQTRAPIGTDRLNVDLGDSSPVGITLRTVWMRGLTTVCDDWRVEGLVGQDLARMRGAVAAAVAAGYGKGADAKATRSRGFATAQIGQGSVLVTGEVPPETTKQSERSVHLRVTKAELDLAREDNAYDAWKLSFQAGPANALFGAYIQWLAVEIEAAGGVEQFVTRVTREASQWEAAYAQGRHSRTVASAAMGWVHLRRFADSVGMAHLLPATEVIESALATLVSGNSSAAEEGSLGRVLTERIGSLIRDGGASLDTTENTTPDEPLRWGWRVSRDVPGQEPSFEAGRLRLGWVSGNRHTPEGERRVIVKLTAMQAVWEQLYPGSSWQTARRSVETALVPHVEVGPMGKVMTKRRCKDSASRREGFTFTLAALGLESDVDEAPEPVKLATPAPRSAPRGYTPPARPTAPARPALPVREDDEFDDEVF